MPSSVLRIAILASTVGFSYALFRNCSANTDGNTLSCYTCMGRDLENCLNGEVCCKGSCYKLVDEEHQIIVKGCTGDDEEDGSMKKRKLDVTLYWTKNEPVSGKSYFCNSGDYCNPAARLTAFSSVAALLLVLL